MVIHFYFLKRNTYLIVKKTTYLLLSVELRVEILRNEKLDAETTPGTWYTILMPKESNVLVIYFLFQVREGEVVIYSGLRISELNQKCRYLLTYPQKCIRTSTSK